MDNVRLVEFGKQLSATRAGYCVLGREVDGTKVNIEVKQKGQLTNKDMPEHIGIGRGRGGAVKEDEFEYTGIRFIIQVEDDALMRVGKSRVQMQPTQPTGSRLGASASD